MGKTTPEIRCFGDFKSLYRKGDSATSLYLINEGRVLLHSGQPTHPRSVVGESFGVFAAGRMIGFDSRVPGQHYQETALTLEPTIATLIEPETIHDYPILKKQYDTEVVAYALQMRKRVEIMQRPASTRLVTILMELAKSDPEDRLLVQGFNEHSIADLVGSSREYVSRAVSKLLDENVLQFLHAHSTREILIANPDLLSKLAKV